MDADDPYEIMQRVGQPLAAIGALAASGEYALARQHADSLSHEDLVALVVFLARLHAGGLLSMFERQGHTQEQARAMATEMFRMQALSFPSPGDGQPGEAG